MTTLNREKAAAVLVDAAYTTDVAAAQKHGVSRRTIRNWRQRLNTDRELAALFHAKNRQATSDWADSVNDAIASGINFLKRAGEQADPKDPEAIHAVAGAVKLLAEVQMTRKVLDARLTGANRQQPAQTGKVATHRQRAE